MPWAEHLDRCTVDAAGEVEGRIRQNVDFGFGILGRLYQGGWFRLQRVQVSPTEWKTESLEVHLTVRALLVKSFARETSETRGGFEPVPTGLNLAQGMAILQQLKPKRSPATGRRFAGCAGRLNCAALELSLVVLNGRERTGGYAVPSLSFGLVQGMIRGKHQGLWHLRRFDRGRQKR